MKRITVSCPKIKKPAKVCELVREESGVIRMEIKFPQSELITINLSDYLQQLEAQ